MFLFLAIVSNLEIVFYNTNVLLLLLFQLPGDDESGVTCRTYVFQDESHTLGNALKTIINR